MKLFQRFALISTIGTYVVIFIGGLVRVSGAGLGCPDWPQCFGRWIPPTSIDQLPAHIDPSRFNFVLAWIEYLNRVSGMMLGLVILTTALIAITKHRDKRTLLFGSMAAAVLVALLGLQGRMVIISELEPMIVTVHMLLAQVLGSLLIFVTYKAYHYNKPLKVEIPKATGKWVFSLWLIGVIQVVFGTQIRSKLEMIAEQFPLLSDSEWLKKVGMLNHLHMTIGFVLAILTTIICWRIFINQKEQNLIKISSLLVIVAITVQLVLGIVFISVGMAELVRVFHLWIASIYLGLLFLIFTAIKSVRK